MTGAPAPAAPAPSAPPAPMRTVSLRRRVTVLVLVVMAVVLTVSGVAVDTVFAAQSRRDETTLLAGRLQLARQLGRQGVAPGALARRVGGPGVAATVTLADGSVFGDDPPAPGAATRTVTTTVTGPGRVGGARVLVAVDTTAAVRAQRRLRTILLVAGLLALVAAGAAVAVGTRRALAPLDTMTGLARSIATGRRGGRLHPSSTGTELGRTAEAFDAMLDSLETAEASAQHAAAVATESDRRTRRFVADAAHELRTPVAGVLAATEAQQPDVPEADRERLRALGLAEARRMAGLVDELLESARLDEGAPLELTDTDLAALVTAEADRVRLTAPTVAVETRVEPVRARVDAGRVAAAVANLASNAVAAMGGGPGSRLELLLHPAAPGWVWVEVIDSGPGVPPPDRERIFDRLVRLGAARQRESGAARQRESGAAGQRESGAARQRGAGGSGLGLAIARSTARRHGGDLVCLDREDGRPGARFVLALPVTPQLALPLA